MLKKFLLKGQSKWQFFFSSAGFVLGLAMLMLALQLYLSFNAYLESQETQNEFLVVTKQVSAANSLGFLDESFQSRFQEREIRQIGAQPFVVDFTPIIVNKFPVQTNLEQVLDLQTDIYFEAVPDKFLDTIPKRWGWQEGQQFVPLIIPREWLDIYNFNVSLLYGTPQISPETLKQMTFQVRIGSRSNFELFEGAIVGYSYRLSSPLIPMSLMEWANEMYGTKETGVSKVLIQVEDAANPAIAQYFAQNRYSVNQERLNRQSFKTVAEVISSVAGGVGFLFVVLSIVIFLIAMQVIIYRSRDKIELLSILGYKPAQLSKTIMNLLLLYLGIAVLAAIVIFIIATQVLKSHISDYGLDDMKVVGIWPIVAAVAVAGITFLINYWTVKKMVRGFYPG